MVVSTKARIQSLIQSNRLPDAKQLAKQLCRKNKRDAEAWFLLGSIYGQTGNLEKAIDSLERSITIQGNIPATHLNLGLVYMRQARTKHALACFEKALKLDPGSTVAHRELANALQSGGRADESIAHYLAALRAEPDSPASLFNLSSAYLSTGKQELAIPVLQQALKLQPSNPDAHFMLGNLLVEKGNYESAAIHFRTAITQRPNFSEAQINLGNVLLRAGANEEAIAAYQKALQLDGDSADILFNLGNAYRATGELQQAENAYRRSLGICPDMHMALNNLGITLLETGDMEGAETCYLDSIAQDEHQVDAYINLANCYRDQRKPEKALATLQKALPFHPEQAELHWDLSLLLLATGRFHEGWTEYEWRRRGGGIQIRDFPFLEWRGEPPKEKTLLVTAEQGIGDEIMFASCFNDILEKSGHVVIECEPRLASLFKRSFPAASVHGAKQTSDFSWLSDIKMPDIQISAGSLPLHFRNETSQFPRHKGYLSADPTEVERWRQRYAELHQPLTVGLSWKGGHISQMQRRSTLLEKWGPILKIPRVCFVNLQYGENREEREQIENRLNITVHHWPDSDPLTDMDNFAAQIAALDLVISVDNSTVHLAGALGKETWVLQSYVADWRWMTPSVTSCWYPSVRQIYQSAPQNWTQVIESVAADLKNRVPPT